MKVNSSKRVVDSCSENRKSKIGNRKLVGLVVHIVTFASRALSPTKPWWSGDNFATFFKLINDVDLKTLAARFTR